LHQTAKLDQLLADAGDWGVQQFINIGTSITANAEAVAVADAYNSVYAAVAIYPHEHRADTVASLMTKLEDQARSSGRVVAIGECGIDVTAWKAQRPLEEQIVLFELQVQLAQRLTLPIIIHNRNGDAAVLAVLARYGGVRGVVHCFDATWDVAQHFMQLGLYLSFSGLITYPAKAHLLEVVAKVPADRLLLETDSPYLLPEPAKSEVRDAADSQHTGGRKNEPKYVRMVGQKVAEVRGISLEEVALQATTNTRQLFGLEG
jgi:TatD DNase family protein